MSADNSKSPGNNPENNGERCIVLDHKNALDILLMKKNGKEFELINGKDYWHEITVVRGASGDREAILKEIMNTVRPLNIVPTKVRDDGNHLYFLVSKSGQAIQKLCRLKLTIKMGDTKLLLRILPGYAPLKDIPLNFDECMKNVIRKRYNISKKHLDLSEFHKDPDLVNKFFCPLSQGTTLIQMLNNIVHAHLDVRSLNLAKNDISFVRSLGCSWPLKQLTYIDLRWNMISNVSELSILRYVGTIQELLLDQNPICEKYDKELSYMEDIQNVLPSLKKLDGVILGFPRFIKNCILPEDNIPLADQFIRQYFTLYDGGNRRKLEGLYHKRALFSLSATYLPDQCTSNTARLSEYTCESRNLIKSSDYSKNMRLLRVGPEEISRVLCKLPRTEHDPYSFSVDVVQRNSGVVMSVSGVFKEPSLVDTPLVRSFYRVFVLVTVGPKAYQIANEEVHVSNATTEQVETSFQIKRPVITPRMLSTRPQNQTESDRDKMIDIISKLTSMNKKWSRKCLNEARWNFKEALTVFTELYELGKVPEDAFR